VSSAVLAEDGKMKPGLSEMRVVHQVMDGRDMNAQMSAAQDKMQEALASITPEQRR